MERIASFHLNRKAVNVKTDDDRMLLWVLRSDLGLTGKKFGCGQALCGACTVVVGGQAVRSCATPLKDFLAGECLRAARKDSAANAPADHRRHGRQPPPLWRARAHRSPPSNRPQEPERWVRDGKQSSAITTRLTCPRPSFCTATSAMGPGYALSEEVRFQGGKVLNRNFEDYAIPRFSALPKIEVVLVDNPQMAAMGAGEPPIVCMGAALANAIYDATGARLLELPMTPEKVKAALG